MALNPTTGFVNGSAYAEGLKLGATVVVDSILDEDTLVSDSATALATQQSIKAYVDAAAGGGTPTDITVANEATDTTCFPSFFTAATGDLGPKTNAGLTFNSATSILGATGFSGPLTGNVTGDVSGNAGTVTDGVYTDDADVSSNSWVLDEDDMASDSNTKVPTQQSVKKYVDDNAGGGYSAETILARSVNPFDPSSGDVMVNFTISSNTTLSVGQVEIPFDITAAQFSFYVVAANVAGTLDVTLYAEDGQSQVFAETTTSISGSGMHSHTFSSPVTIPAGIYYLGFNPNSTANIIVYAWDTDIGFSNLWSYGVSGKPKLEGTTTITAGTPPATFTPSGLTSAVDKTVITRFDT
jgi:hypothetical protein